MTSSPSSLQDRRRPRDATTSRSAYRLGLALAVMALVAIATGVHREEGSSAVEILWLSACFTAPFLACAWLFRRAGRTSPRSV